MARRAWRTFQITVGAGAAVLLLHYSDNRTAYELSSAGAYYISPDPSVSATNGLLIAAGSDRSFAWITGCDTEMSVYAFNATGQAIVVTIREDIQEKADQKVEIV